MGPALGLVSLDSRVRQSQAGAQASWRLVKAPRGATFRALNHTRLIWQGAALPLGSVCALNVEGLRENQAVVILLVFCRFICVAAVAQQGAEPRASGWRARSVQALPGSGGSAGSAVAANIRDWRSPVLPGTCGTAPHLLSKNHPGNSARPFARAELCSHWWQRVCCGHANPQTARGRASGTAVASGILPAPAPPAAAGSWCLLRWRRAEEGETA